MNAGLSFDQYKLLAESSLRTMGFRKNSELILDAMARRLMRWGIPDSETAVKECHLYLIEMEAKYDLEFRTGSEYDNYKGERCGYISIIKKDDDTSMTKIPYSFDKETGKIQIELPEPLCYARKLFDILVEEIQEQHDKELLRNKKRGLEKEER